MRKLGFKQSRVRHHKNIARIEIEERDMLKAIDNKDKITKKLNKLGYIYVTLDLIGYRTGAMNEVLLP